MGSTATQRKPYSDIDMVIILDDHAPDLFTSFTFFHGVILDLYFFKTARLRELLHGDTTISRSSIEGKLIAWLHAGSIVYDPTHILTELKESISISDLNSQSSKDQYNIWFGICFNYYHNKRYFDSNDLRYLDALEVRLLHSLFDLLLARIAFSNSVWTGEKEALLHLEQHDSQFLVNYLQCLRASGLKNKFSLYADLAQQTASLYRPIWDSQDVHSLLNGEADNFLPANTFVTQIISQ